MPRIAFSTNASSVNKSLSTYSFLSFDQTSQNTYQSLSDFLFENPNIFWLNQKLS